MNMEDVELIFCGDMHLSHTPPVARSGEKDWYKTQGGYIEQLFNLTYGVERKEGRCQMRRDPIPVVVPGDIFDKWNPCPELVNFAIKELPLLHAIPGNHDLPNHRYEDVEKSGYWTLVMANTIRHLYPHEPTMVGLGICLYGFPYGTPPIEDAKVIKNSMVKDLAVCHEYIWTQGKGHAKAPESGLLKNFRKRMSARFDLIVTGDNHTPFTATKKEPWVVNCGGFMRRTIAEIDYKPRVWLLKRDGSITPHYLDISKDVIYSPNELGRKAYKDSTFAQEVLDELRKDRQASMTFEEELIRSIKDGMHSSKVQSLLLEILEEARR